MTDLFNSPVLLVEQPLNFFSTESRYTVFDPQGVPLAYVSEPDLNVGRQAMRFFMSKSSDNMRHTLQVIRPDGMPMLTIDKPFALVTPNTQVMWGNGQPVGSIKKEFSFRPRYLLLDAYERQVAEIGGNFVGWDFAITDWQGNEVARVTKHFEGLAAAFFTTADRYAVQIHYQLPEPLRSLVLASAITIDVTMNERRG